MSIPLQAINLFQWGALLDLGAINALDYLFQTTAPSPYTPWHRVKQDGGNPTLPHLKHLVSPDLAQHQDDRTASPPGGSHAKNLVYGRGGDSKSDGQDR